MGGFIKVVTGGRPLEIGYDVGRATADILRELAAANPSFYRRQTRRSFAFLKKFARRNFLPYCRRFFPEYLEEIAGMAEGAGLDFEDLFIFSAEEELLDLWGGWDKCSSAAVRTRRGLYLLHNEDYIGRYHRRLVLIEAKPRGRPAFLSLGYPGTLAGSACGFNDAGVAFGGNSLRFPPGRAGIPKNFVLRKMLAARSLRDVERIMAIRPRLVSNNVTVVSARENAAAYVEAGPGRSARVDLGAAGILTHTNHILSPDIDTRQERPTRKSFLRLASLDYLLSRRRGRFTLGGLKKTLSSGRGGLCYFNAHPEKPTTLASIVMDPARGRMFVANRCGDDPGYREYRLRGR
jgi:isopenicillin-N N-acyltransferase like protein